MIFKEINCYIYIAYNTYYISSNMFNYKNLLYIISLVVFFSCHGHHAINSKDPAEIIEKKEQLSLNKDYSTIGDLIYTIDFQVKTDNVNDYEDGFIPWIQLEKPDADMANLHNKDEIVLNNSSVEILIDYPLNKEYKFTITSEKGFTREQLLHAISKQYYILYEEEENSATVKTVPLEKRTTMYNRNETDGKYGIWGHDIADLVLSSILVYRSNNGKTILALQIES